MKRGRDRIGNWGEGWLLAAALGLILIAFLGIGLSRLPRTETVEPVHFASLEELRRIELVDINRDSAEKLARLPGIGDVLAGRIVTWREEHGPFSAAEELMNVPGIGEGKFAAVEALVFCEKMG